MSKINYGGPAFPRTGIHDQQFGQIEPSAEGMSLRDWFAGQALAGITAGHWGNEAAEAVSNSALAGDAYSLADAMLAAREASS